MSEENTELEQEEDTEPALPERLSDSFSLRELQLRLEYASDRQSRLYLLILLSFLVDLVVAWLPELPTQVNAPFLVVISECLLLLALFGFARERIIRKFFDFDRYQQGIQDRASHYSFLLVGVLGLLIVADVIVRSDGADILVLVIAALSMLGSLPGLIDSAKKAKELRETLRTNERMRFERNLRIVNSLVLAPPILARAAALAAIIARDAGLESQLLWLTALLTYLALAPQKSHLLTRCQFCGLERPRIGRLSYCRSCPTEDLSSAKEEAEEAGETLEPPFLSNEFFVRRIEGFIEGLQKRLKRTPSEEDQDKP